MRAVCGKEFMVVFTKMSLLRRKVNLFMNTSWKQLIGRLEEITRGTGRDAWESANIIRDLWRSKEFLSEGCDNRLDDLTEKLAVFSGRFALGLNDMLQMIDNFPELKDWERCRLDVLRDKTIRILEAGRKKPETRDRVSRAEFEKLKAENERLKARCKELEQELEKLKQGVK